MRIFFYRIIQDIYISYMLLKDCRFRKIESDCFLEKSFLDIRTCDLYQNLDITYGYLISMHFRTCYLIQCGDFYPNFESEGFQAMMSRFKDFLNLIMVQKLEIFSSAIDVTRILKIKSNRLTGLNS